MWSSLASSLPKLFTATNSKTVQLSTGIIQLNTELTVQPNIERIELPHRVNAFAVILPIHTARTL